MTTTQVLPPQAPGKRRWYEKFVEEPLVPLGMGLTCVALLAASVQMRKGDRKKMNKFLRYRVYAQGLTVLAALGGTVYYGTERSKRAAEQRDAARFAREQQQAAREAAGLPPVVRTARPVTVKPITSEEDRPLRAKQSRNQAQMLKSDESQ
ncbi:uncharacterized protein L969DRAFT_102694 [Mixia osmundae IAM 14324]|uniref:HIG1 domain-containing protein n=1 Tax=Mixia osmundae (strain CBS 9802 / IAM 14324 / JCM 22182 / KY 12970) TaxID=764103 RepID=G7E9K6_MIXOS|nr:uncharacterized protein L969DRAFT_102694 [Mixia osmundae IAM 14324]KEI39956.1 hypothetical protein L969DRAFT_102694 [Mixia osmundae IAM 14324]GAA99325.1 hypothetical protein E5Q_06020 [Mixia osmundae IAM 14324]